MISFTDITESIRRITNNNKQKATTERIFNFLKKRDHYKDLSALDLDKNDKNSLFIGTSTTRISKKDHKSN